MLRKFILLASVIGLLMLIPMLAQEKNGALSAIERAISDKNYKQADSLLQQAVSNFVALGNIDTLEYFIPLAGKIADEQGGSEKAVQAVTKLLELIISKSGSPLLISNAHLAVFEYLGLIRQDQLSYTLAEKGLSYARQIQGNNVPYIANWEYNLGNIAHRLGNVTLSLKHYRECVRLRESSSGVIPEELYFTYNAMGSMMWYSTKYDSATYYFEKSLDALKKMPDNDLNKYYRPGNIYNNLAALYNVEGQTTKAIEAMELTIASFQQFIASKEDHPKKKDATSGLFEAIDNLGGIYREFGDYGRGGELLRYSYQEKLKTFPAGHPGIFISEILLGQHYVSVNEYDQAFDFLSRGLEKLEKTEGDYLFWAGDGYYNLAMVFDHRREVAKATEYFEKAEALYDQSYQGFYDNVFMDFLRNEALFYARNNQYEKAMSKAKKVLAYLEKVKEERSMQGFYQLLNMAEISYLSKQFPQSIQYSNQALSLVNDKMKESSTVLDSVKMQVHQPSALLMNAKASYELQQNRDTTYLKALTLQLNEALQILEKRKVLIDDAESINILIADNAGLIDFAKKIELELFNLTGDEAYLDKFINLHESGIYNRIRSRMDKQQAIRFTKLPIALQNAEKQRKAAISMALRSDKPKTELMNEYWKAISQWESHLDTIKNQYPDYYAMRYASIFRSLPQLQTSLPKESSIVRYFFVDTMLYALVADSTHKKIVPLVTKGLEDQIRFILNPASGEKEMGIVLHQLYETLWQPLSADIRTKKVLIIPDDILFNLSFEMLTPKPITSYRDLASNSLLAQYAISYHYSLFMLGNDQYQAEPDKNYIAFAPGFSDEIKKQYQSIIKDSVKLDYQYLSLLPQPNTNKLAIKIRQLLGGNTYLDDASTQSSFKKNAGGHKIIHIGTHAEYNNMNPERSRLIFAKDSKESLDSNSLYLYDIYNCNVNSDLMILTACESGRPGYQDGEGMVSLAHAFNYAGSKSILTGLWKIDEQSSNQITDKFVQLLKEGIPADEALRSAKLYYLSMTDGRVLAPIYWAGLVLMGEPAIIKFAPTTNYTWLYATGAIMLIAGIFFWLYRRRTRSA